MNPLDWAKLVLVAALVGVLGFGVRAAVLHVEQAGAATCEAQRATDRAALAVAAAASQAAMQADSAQKDQAYVDLLQARDRDAAAHAAVAGSLRQRLQAAAAAASAAASAPGNSCASQDRQIAGGASVADRGVDLVDRGQRLVTSLSDQLTALQKQCQ